MSDQPGIPAILVCPPFSPGGSRPPEASPPAQAVDQAPPPAVAEPTADGPTADASADAAASPDFASRGDEPWRAAPADEVEGAPEAGPAETPLTDEEDLPWLEVPAPRDDAPQPASGLKADDAPNWMDWVRDAEQPAASADEPAASEAADSQAAMNESAMDQSAADEPTPVEDLAPDDAQPWSSAAESAADDWASAPEAAPEPWRAPEGAGDAEPWRAPREDAPAADWPEPGSDLELPDPELYDLPPVAPSDAAWSAPEGQADEGDDGEAEPAWELPAQGTGDAPPAWESFTSSAPAPAAEEAPAQPAAAASGASPFAGVADRLEAIARALRDDPNAFLSGAQGGGDPLALLVAGFVLGWQARQGS